MNSNVYVAKLGKTVNLLTFTPQDWKININKPIYDWTIDEIPWNELD